MIGLTWCSLIHPSTKLLPLVEQLRSWHGGCHEMCKGRILQDMEKCHEMCKGRILQITEMCLEMCKGQNLQATEVCHEMRKERNLRVCFCQRLSVTNTVDGTGSRCASKGWRLQHVQDWDFGCLQPLATRQLKAS